MDAHYVYHDYSVADPPHQPLYLNRMVAHLRRANCCTVLDAGCGDGNFADSLADLGFHMFGIDLSEGGIDRATRRGRAGTSFAVASVYDDYRTVFPECKEFDAIISVEVVEHLYFPRRLIRRASEALRPGGLLIITTPYWGYLKNVLLSLSNRMDRALTALWDGGHIKHWSRRTLCKLVEECPFDLVAFHGCGRRVPLLWKGMMLVFRKRTDA